MLPFAGMSPIEVQFIRVYVNALRKHYDTIRTAIDIMNPKELGVSEFATASRFADKMRDLHSDFDAAIRKIHKKHKTPIKPLKPSPTEDELADLFGLSFFKVVTKANFSGDAAQFVIPHEGWFSGKPNEWKSSIKAYKETPKPTTSNLAENILSQYLELFSKFFNVNNALNKNNLFGGKKKVWPMEQDFFDEHDGYIDDDDDADEIDTAENPFGWLFDNQDDDDE